MRAPVSVVGVDGLVRALRIAGVVSVVALIPAVSASSAPAEVPDSGPVAAPGWPAVSDTDLRAALLAAPAGEVTEIRLGTTWLWRRVNEPLVIRTHVRIIGDGPTRTVIDAAYRSQIFDVLPGAVLELESLSLFRGSRDAAPERRVGARIELDDVLIGAGAAVGADDIAAYCLSGDVRDSQYYRVALLTDPLAVGNVPGDAF